ncbi:glycoside hydrolase family 16 protein [Congregibacter brevis]|uniref:Glycoside hydrolase family 16 protein n=1 Tax=Congregibacter brevis TaxID=3081201 RepID=A0ABZ0IFT9_9GAMM|nr:glycoside hydrolase family 16 protein [Congregibacter sp. IMCC45268]
MSLILILQTGIGWTETNVSDPQWAIDFFDDFDTFDEANWRDQIVWVNGEDHCYVRDGLHNTREVNDGSLKLRVVDLGEPQPCGNMSKNGEKHPDTAFVAGRISSKNRREFVKGRWTARLRVPNSGQRGMFPAWWLLGALNNEPPIEEDDENVCWPMEGSGEIDIFEHHGDGGPDHYAARIIENRGYCDGGDWQSAMLVQEANMEDYHEYAVEWLGNDIIFRLDGAEVYRVDDKGDLFPEPLFAILNFAKIQPGPMTGPWVMEVDWVKHESLVKDL